MTTYYLWSVVRWHSALEHVRQWRQPDLRPPPFPFATQQLPRLKLAVVQQICKAILNMRLRVRHEDTKARNVRPVV